MLIPSSHRVARPASVTQLGEGRPLTDADLAMLRDYQREGVAFLRANKRALLGDEMRLGKTVQALMSLPRRARAIVVAPACVIGVWGREIERWRSDLRARLRPKKLARPQPGELFVTSWDSLPKRRQDTDMTVLADLSDVYLIGDEAQKAMTPTAERTKRFRALRRQCRGCWLLTGTPMPGDPEQLWGVLVSGGLSYAFDDDCEGFLALCGAKPKILRLPDGRLVQKGYTWGTIDPQVGERLRRVMLRRVASELVDLPERIYQDVPASAPKSSDSADWTGVDERDENFSRIREQIAAGRADEATRFAVEMSVSLPVLVFSCHVAPILAFEGVPNAGYVTGEGSSGGSRERTIERFRKGDLKILAMTIQTGGVGLDLSRADGVLFIDLPYTPGELDQATARALAVGKKTPVIVWRMTSDHPVEVRVREILDEKRRLQAETGL